MHFNIVRWGIFPQDWPWRKSALSE